MSKEKKGQIIGELQEIFSGCSITILTDYRGLSTAEVTALRQALRKSSVDYRVVKNTLARFAVERVGKNELARMFDGPVAIAYGYDDITEPAKAIADYIRREKTSLSVKGGFFGDTVLTPADIETLAKLPAREILIAQVLAGMQSPIVTLVNCLAAPMRGVIGALQARIKQLEGE